MSTDNELEKLRRENEKLRGLLQSVGGNVVYIALKAGEGRPGSRIRTCTTPSYAKRTYHQVGWTVFEVNLTLLTIKQTYPEKE